MEATSPDRFEFNMTPMIDVVFLLVIFFLLSSHLASRETRLELPLPQASTGLTDDRTAARVTLNILPNQMLLGSSPVALEQLPARLRSARSKEGNELELRIRADRDVEYARVAPALRAAAEVGIWDINLAVHATSSPKESQQ